MLKNYFTVAYRNLINNRIYSLINIFGLAIGMAVCFFIFQYVHFESSYDTFNKNIANIYRVNISYSGSFSNLPPMSTNHPAVGPAVKAEFQEVVDYARVVNPVLFLPAYNISYTDANGNKVVFAPEKCYFADAAFLTMFSFPFVAGDPSKALAEANTVVISEKIAQKYFGKSDPMGKTLQLTQRWPLKVTGVFKEVPENSHIKFDMLMSFNSLSRNFLDNNWTYPEFYTYIQLASGTDPKKLEAKFPAFINLHLDKVMKRYNFGTYFHLQPLAGIHLRSDDLKGPEDNGSEKEIYFLTVIGIFVLVIAWINYVNLSTAKSMERAREVGMRKVVGALRYQLIGQFLTESLLVNLLALILAAAIVLVCFPHFGAFIGKDIRRGSASSGLWQASRFWVSLVTIFFTGALLVGAYPAFILSAYNPVLVLKGRFFQSAKGILLRKVLVSFQFVLSLLLIAGTVTVFRQLSFMQNQSLGYNKDQVVVVRMPPALDSTFDFTLRSLQAQLLRQSSIVDATVSSEIPGKDILMKNSIRKDIDDKTHNFLTKIVEVDDHFVNTYQMGLAAGRNFTIHDTSDYRHKYSIIVNEEVVKALGYKNNEAAIHQNVNLMWGSDEHAEIIGVLSNYHQRSLREGYDPIVYLYPTRTDWGYMSIQVRAGNLSPGLSVIEDSYKNTFAGAPFNYFFLNEYFDRQYQSDQRFGKVFYVFTLLTIFVACLGLLGLSSFMVRLRVREVGIRKVLGASLYHILALFSKDFVMLVVIASAIALPITYFLVHLWLYNYAFHIRIDGLLFIAPPLILLLISLITIGLQSVKAALANPVTSIKGQ